MLLAASPLDEDSLKSVRSCPDCGQLNHLAGAEEGTDASCSRCGKLLQRLRHRAYEKALGLGLTAMLFYLLLAVSPFLDVSIFGRYRSSTLRTGAEILDQEQFWLLSAVVLMTTLIMPLIKLGLTLYVLIGSRLSKPPRGIVHCFRWAREVSRWSMLEVYLLGLLVAYTRLQALAFVRLDVAVYALIGTVLAMTAMDAVLDAESLWQDMQAKGFAPFPQSPSAAANAVVVGCHVCHQASLYRPQGHCPRCGAPLHLRKPNSYARAWALISSAAIFYIPANYYPVMTITKLGKTTSHTIIGGMLELFHIGMWPLALLVFVASIAIPMVKLLLLSYILIETHWRSGARVLLRTRMYRVIDFIGRWSMVDVFMVSILAGLVQFGRFAEVTAGVGAACFAAVVILTILAVESFDPRLIWDNASENRPRRVRAMVAGVA